jgi:Tfp pilus assembly protein FimV
VTSKRVIRQPRLKLDIVAFKQGDQVLAESYHLMLTSKPDAPKADFQKYGPVKKKETLKSIAAKVKPPTIGLDKARKVIYTANPHAFYNGDADQLIPGSFLIIPDLAYQIDYNQVTNKDRINNLKTTFNKKISQINKRIVNINTKQKNIDQKMIALKDQLDTLAQHISRLEKNDAQLQTSLESYKDQKQNNQADQSNQPSQNTVKQGFNDDFYWFIGLIILLLILLWLIYRLFKQKPGIKHNANHDSKANHLLINIPWINHLLTQIIFRNMI